MASELVPAQKTDNNSTEECLEPDLEIQLDAATVPGKGSKLDLERSSDDKLVR